MVPGESGDLYCYFIINLLSIQMIGVFTFEKHAPIFISKFGHVFCINRLYNIQQSMILDLEGKENPKLYTIWLTNTA